MWVNRELFKRQWKYIFGILWSADTQWDQDVFIQSCQVFFFHCHVCSPRR
jgi:hypothetical protein